MLEDPQFLHIVPLHFTEPLVVEISKFLTKSY
jgi:hypothetical protein